MKKLCAVILAAVVLLSSCGKTADDSKVSGTTTDSNAVTTTSPTKQAMTTTAPEHDDGLIYSEEDIAGVLEQISETKTKHPDKTVVTCLIDFGRTDFEDAINDYLDSIGSELAISLISMPYVFGFPHPYFPDRVKELIDRGVQIDILAPTSRNSTDAEENNYHRDALEGLLEPLDEYFENTESGRAFYASMPENYFNAFRVNGKIYGVTGVMTNHIGGLGYSVDKALAEKYGFDVNKPITEQLSVIEEVVKGEDDTVGVSMWNYGMVDHYPDRFDHWLGVYFDSENDCVARITEHSEYLNGLDMFYKIDKRLLSGSITGMDSLNNACLVMFTGYRYYGETGDVITERYGDSISERILVIDPEPKITNIFSAITISSGSQLKDEAFEMLMLMQTDPVFNNLISYGPEGGEYTLENGRAVVDPLHFDLRNFAQFANLGVCYPYGRYADTINQDYRTFYETAGAVPYLGFAFDVRPVAEEYKKVKSTMTDHVYLNYKSAEESIAALDVKLTEAGIDAVIDEMNRQYCEWKANKS